MKKKLQAAGLIFTMLLLAKVGMAQTYTFSPANDATGVSTSPTLTITFDGPVTLGSYESIYLKKEGGTQVKEFLTGRNGGAHKDPCLVVSGKILKIDLSQENLKGNTFYYVTAEADAIFVGGNPWDGLKESENSSIWSFTTGAAPVPPSIVNYTPEPGSTGVSVNPTFIVEFDGDIDSISKGSSGYFKIMLGSTEEHSISSNSSKVSVSGKTLTVDATDLTLAYNSEYHIEIDQDFIQNFAGILDVNEWEFTTEIDGPKWAEGFPNITQSLTDFTFTGKTDLGGTYYFVVTDNFKPPTIAQIKAGQNHLGAKAYESGYETMIGNNEFIKSKGFSEMTSRIPYYLHAVVTSDDEKNSEIETLFIDRIRPIIEDESSNPINGYHLFNVHDSIKIVFSKEVFNYNGEITELTSASFNLKNGEEIVRFDFSVSPDGTEITLTPQSPLSGNTEYTVVISPLSDEFYNVMTSSVTRTFYTDQLNVWNGISSELWEGNGNWTEAYVAGKSVLIQSGATHYPTINSIEVSR